MPLAMHRKFMRVKLIHTTQYLLIRMLLNHKRAYLEMPKSCNFKGRRSLFILSKALFMSCKTKAESSCLSMPVKMTSVELISAVSVGFLFPLYFPERQLFLVKYFSLHLTVLVIIRSACYHRVIHSVPHLEKELHVLVSIRQGNCCLQERGE